MKNRRGSNSWNLSRFCVWRCVNLVAWLFLGCGFFHINAATLPAGFTESQWGSGISGAATAMAFAPDGRLFVCLQSGQVRVINKDGVLLANPFVTLSVDSNGERGLLEDPLCCGLPSPLDGHRLAAPHRARIRVIRHYWVALGQRVRKSTAGCLMR